MAATASMDRGVGRRLRLRLPVARPRDAVARTSRPGCHSQREKDLESAPTETGQTSLPSLYSVVTLNEALCSRPFRLLAPPPRQRTGQTPRKAWLENVSPLRELLGDDALQPAPPLLPDVAMRPFVVPDWSAAKWPDPSGWRDFGPADWPRPHAGDTVFRQLRVYVYPLPKELTYDVLRSAAEKLYRAGRGGSNCLVHYCSLGWSHGANNREFTSEIPVHLRLLQTTTIVEDASQADAFVVPIPLGTYQALCRWLGSAQERDVTFPGPPELTRRLSAHLPHLNASTASRHVFFQSMDSVFVGLAPMTSGKGPPWIPAESIVFHLGDDLWYYGRLKFGAPMKRGATWRPPALRLAAAALGPPVP